MSEVHAISPNEGNGATSITITGTGFGSSADCVRVSVGGVYVSVQSPVTDTRIVARIRRTDEIIVGVPLPIGVDVIGKGLARNAITEPSRRTFTMRPSMESITPAVGSFAGDTTVVIAGTGFLDESGSNDISVRFGEITCDVQTDMYTYNEITCVTPSSTNADAITYEVVVMVKSQQAHCVGSCEYTYSQSATPQLDSVTPSTVSEPRSITLSGQRFTSTPSDVTVTIGSTACQVTNSGNQQITCDVETLPVGDNPIDVHIVGKGKAIQPTPVTLTQDLILTSIDPAEGSTGGGMTVQVSGMGFIPGSTTVDIGGAVCAIQQPITSTLITCITGERNAGNPSVRVTINGIRYTSSFTYRYSNALTPQVNSINATVGRQGDPLKITGSGFTTVPRVVIGGANCNIITATDTEIECTAGGGPNGEFPVDVHVDGKGKALTTAAFKYRIDLVSLEPNSGLKNKIAYHYSGLSI